MFDIVYFSNVSENTKRFVEKLKAPAQRIPIRASDDELRVTNPYVLITPSYGNDDFDSGVPQQVKKFLNVAENRNQLRGVIASGNTNFGIKFCCAGEVISKKCKVPLLYKFELIGTSHDLDMVNHRLNELWSNQ